MVRVFRCHRFVSQDVISTSSEPTVTCSNGDRLFVACDNYTIQEFCLGKAGCEKVRQFAAIGRVLQMVYSHEGEFLATIEEDAFQSAYVKSQHNLSFRVYSNLRAVSKGVPMKMRISGQVTRAIARHNEDTIDTTLPVVIEVPLKKPPTCISAYAQNVAIALKKMVLVYRCEKKDDRTQDIRCILELEFTFTVRKIELCEEFIMCSSGMECQIVQLNFDNSVKSQISSTVFDVPGPLNVQSFFEHRALQSPSASYERQSFKPNDFHENFNSRRCEECQRKASALAYNPDNLCQHCVREGALSEVEMADGVLTSRATITENVHLKLNSSLKRPLVVRQDPVSVCFSGPPSPPPAPRKPETKVKETAGGGLELLGPVSGDLHTCAVEVEYEGTQRHNNGRSGVLRNGVTTLLYKKLEPYSHPIHSIQLLPIFLDEEDGSATKAASDCVFLSAKRRRLIGMFSIVSTSTFAYVYSLLSDCRLISSFPYAIDTLQVKLTGSHLFAMSESRLDVYTSRCLSRLIFNAEEIGKDMQQTIPFISDEPCLLGYHMFFDLTAMCQTGDYVTLLSKSASFSRSADNSWSIYILKRPEVADLYHDMVDQAHEWQKAHLSSGKSEDGDMSVSQCLMKEANMLLRSHIYLLRSTEKKKELISLLKSSSLYLAHAYQKHDVDGHIAVPYFLMAGYSLMDIVRSIQDPKAKISSRFRESLIWYARKLTDPRTSNDLVSELANAGIVNGCLKRLRAIANAEDDVNPHSLNYCVHTKPLASKSSRNHMAINPLARNRNSVTNFIDGDLSNVEAQEQNH